MERLKDKGAGRTKKLVGATPDVAARLGLREGEFNVALDVLGRGPTEAECLALVDLWSDIHEELVLRRFLSSEVPESAVPAGVGIIDLGAETLLAVTVGVEHVLSSRAGEYAARAAICEIVEELAAAGGEIVGVSALLRVGDLESTIAQSHLRTLIESAASTLRSLGIPLLATQTVSHARAQESPALILHGLGMLNATVDARKRDRSPGATVIAVGRPLRKNEFRISESQHRLSPDSRANLGRQTLPFADPFTTACFVESFASAREKGLQFDVCKVSGRGISGALFTLASRARLGVQIDLEKFTKATPLTPLETLTIRQPHQFLLVSAKEHHREVVDHFAQWGLASNVVGEMIEAPEVRIVTYHTPLCALPLSLGRETVSLSSADTSAERPKPRIPFAPVAQPTALEDTWLDLLASAAFSSRAGMLREFDLGAGSRILPGGLPESTAVRTPAGHLVVAVSSDTARVTVDPSRGVVSSLVNGVRRVAAAGGSPVAICLAVQSGSFSRERSRSEIAETFKALEETCATLRLPLLVEKLAIPTGDVGATLLTPAVFVVGSVPKGVSPATQVFDQGNERILLLGASNGELDACEYMQVIHGQEGGRIYPIDLEQEERTYRLISGLVREGLVSRAVAVSAGGVAVAFARAVLGAEKPTGARLQLLRSGDSPKWRKDALLFGEQSGRFLVTCRKEQIAEISDRAAQAGVLITGQGKLIAEGEGSETLEIMGDVECSLSLASAEKIYASGLQHIFPS